MRERLYKIRKKEVWGRIMWVGIWEWAHSVRIVVFHVNTDHRAPAEVATNCTMDPCLLLCPLSTCDLSKLKHAVSENTGLQRFRSTKKRTINVFCCCCDYILKFF